MAGEFNPYREWLGIDAPTQPPNHYQLLGLPDFEANPERIWAAAHDRRALLAAQQYGEYPQLAAKLLAEIDAAERCLLNPVRKEEYDGHLRTCGMPPGAPASAPRAQPGEAPTPSIEPPKRRSVWGYDDDVPAAAAAGGAAASPAPTEWAPPMRPEDFLPPPAAPAAYDASGAPAAPYAPSAPMAAPVAGVPVAPLAGDPYYGAQPPMAEIPTALPVYGAQGGVPVAPYAAEVDPTVPLTAAVPGYAAPLAEVPMAAPARAQVPAAAPVAAPWGGSPMTQPAAATPPYVGADIAAPRRRKTESSFPLLLAVGAPMAAAIAVGLLALYVTKTGPFAVTSPHKVADTSVAPGSVAPSEAQSLDEQPFQVQPKPPERKSQRPPEPIDDPEKEPTAEKKQTPKETIPPKQSTPMPDPAAEPKKTLPEKTPSAKTPGEKMPKEKPSKEPTKIDPKQLELVDAALMSARYWLTQRDLTKANQMLALAEKTDGGERAKEIARVKALAHYVDQFWQSVRASAKMLTAGSEITLVSGASGQSIVVSVVEKGADFVILRRAGQNERHEFATMKGGLAYGLAYLYLKKDAAVTHLILGSFLAVNPKNEQGKEQARGQWDTALRLADQELKDEIMLLLAELDIEIPDEPPQLPTLTADGGGGNTKPAKTSTAAKPKTSGDGRQAPPQGDALSKLQAAVRAKYKPQLDAAVFEADKAALAEKLKADAEGDDVDPATRYVLLAEASELAAGGGNLKLAMELIETLERTHVVNVMGLKARALVGHIKASTSPEANKAAAEMALALADEAALMEKYTEALTLAIQASAAARKSKDSSLIKQASQRETEIRALKPK
jgi:hypothetical protein